MVVSALLIEDGNYPISRQWLLKFKEDDNGTREVDIICPRTMDNSSDAYG